MRSVECPACGTVNQVSDREPSATPRCQKCQKRLEAPAPQVRSPRVTPGVQRQSATRLPTEPGTPDPTLFGDGWQRSSASRPFPWKWVGAAAVLAILASMSVFVFDLAKPAAASRWTKSDKFTFASDVYASSILGLQKFDKKYLVGLDFETASSALVVESESTRWSDDLEWILFAELFAKFADLHRSRPQFEIALNSGASGLSDDSVTVSMSIDPAYRHLFSVSPDPRGNSDEIVITRDRRLVESDPSDEDRITVTDGVFRIAAVLPWNKDRLRQLEQPVDIHLKIFARFRDGTTHEWDYPVKVHPPSHVELAYPWGLGFAACVDQAHPWIDAISASISNDADVKAAGMTLAGGGGNADESMYLVWRHLALRGIRYSNLTGTGEEGFQIVQLFHDAYTDKIANCVDGSVMLASIFGRHGLECSLVFVPGHCFLMVDTEHGRRWIETTMLGSVADGQPSRLLLDYWESEKIAPIEAEEWAQMDPHLRTFLEACAKGERIFFDALSNVEDAVAHFKSHHAAWVQAPTKETVEAAKRAGIVVGNHLQLVPMSWARAKLEVEAIGAPTNLPKVPPP